MTSRVSKERRTNGGGKWVKIFGIGAIVTVVLVVVLGFVGFGVAKSWLKNLPDYKNPETFAVAQPTTILASDGTVIAKLYVENRESVDLADMGDYLPKATVAVEDTRFYEHNGFDPIGIARALVKNATSGNATGEGASTLTQQYVRQTILRDEMYTKSYERKVREAYLAYELEKLYTKDEVLEMYLNTVYYGAGAYGCEAAAQEIFAKSVKDLSISEAALLAGLPQQPSRLNPFENPDGAIERRNTVLRRMRDQNVITEAEYDEAVNEKLTFKSLDKPDDGIYYAPYYVAHVKKLLQQELSSGTVFAGGLTVQTPLDLKKQKAAEKAVTSALKGPKNPDGALVSIEPKSGHVVALYGGKNFSKTKFNLATQARRQPGSSFKVFTLLTAIQQGMSPSATINSSSPAKIKTDSGTWTVSNSEGSGHGGVTLRHATELSINTPFARLIMEVNPKKVAKNAKKMGITSEINPVPSIALGAVGVTPLEMASSFGTLATGGLQHDPVFITKVTDKDGKDITDKDGKVIFEDNTKQKRVIDKKVAAATTDVLKGVITNGTATRANIGRPAAGKTGTSQQNRDAWFVGYTPDLVTSVWVGFTPERKGYVNGSLIWGGTTCAPIWREYMSAALKGTPVSKFPNVEDPEYDNSKFKIDHGSGESDPATSGMSLENAMKKYSGYTIKVVEQYSSSVGKGRVISQKVSGNTVTFYVSKGPDPNKKSGGGTPSTPTTGTPSKTKKK